MATLTPEEAATLYSHVMAGGTTFDGIELAPEDVDVSFETKAGFAAAGARVGVIVLETALDDELRLLGFARELQNRIQTARKEMGLEYTDRIQLGIMGGERVRRVVEVHGSEIAREVLATALQFDNREEGATRHEVEIEGEAVVFTVAR